MPTYDYECPKCSIKNEVFHGMTDKLKVVCPLCLLPMIKLIGTGDQIMGMNAGRDLYDFVDTNTTGQPVRIHNKRQWKEHLRQHGLNDDVKNDPYTKAEVEQKVRTKNNDKLATRREIKKSVTEVYKKRKTTEFKNRAKLALKKGG